ncbi:hypothetical protein MPTK1_3g20430 [Marchantia polymorpha subsp. ruderalis]|uniref:Uncharacterized protein n=2 Tax=Marchantia polymorpha TaxID=3197 RepID=A0AAF6B2X2_MARPO|nr:hypothetical protein MARPO_0149s0008 [Marchantia polymorpha]BBN06356.1 hypothetical protein Mp_3g20430 [Marchantia polymorpha subsp. ruderalis]CCI55390.1 NDH subunit PnsB4 [Marchantia polymorpha]|eukprot:PTQ29011.1 hypothetical protein MARPO_0149s0008 [Marchantia polymorpha]
MAMALVRSPGLRAALTRAELPPLASTCGDELWTSQVRSRSGASSAGVSGRLLRSRGMNLSKRVEKRPVAAAAILDPHSFAFLADLLTPELDPTKFGVSLDITRDIVDDRSTWSLGEDAIKHFYMACAFVFCWGCCVFGSMNDKFYESDTYRGAGGNGTGHWIYDLEEREEAAARDEMWSEDLMKEIEEKSEEVRLAEEAEREREKELV